MVIAKGPIFISKLGWKNVEPNKYTTLKVEFLFIIAERF